MMRPTHVLWILVAVGLAAFGAACGSDSPTDSGGGSTYIFEPQPGSFALDAFDSFRVRVRARDGGAVTGTFYLNEDSVATGDSYAWWATKLGLNEIKLEIPSSGTPVEATWSLTVREGATDPPSPVTQLAAGRGDLAGSINLLWERPNQGYEAVDFYRIYYSTSPIDPLQLAGLPFVDQPHSAESVQQDARVEDLQERVRYYMRIKIVDLIGRESEISPQASSMSTGHYDISGRITRLVEDAGGAEAFGSVLIEVGEYKTLSDAQGYYSLTGIPDILRSRLLAKSSTDPFNYYRVETDTLSTVDQNLDLLLIRRSLVRVDEPVTSEIFMLEFLFHMSRKNAINSDGVIRRWESYPIPVMVDPLVVVPGGGDAGASLAEGILHWNEVAGEQLLVAVTGAPSYGADYVIVDSQPIGGAILGEVVMIDPANASCLFQCIPEKVRVNISRNNTPSVMDLVAVHELGHVLWMGHSLNSEHVMSAGVLGSSTLIPQRDEVLAARYIKHIPNGTSLRWYKDPDF